MVRHFCLLDSDKWCPPLPQWIGKEGCIDPKRSRLPVGFRRYDTMDILDYKTLNFTLVSDTGSLYDQLDWIGSSSWAYIEEHASSYRYDLGPYHNSRPVPRCRNDDFDLSLAIDLCGIFSYPRHDEIHIVHRLILQEVVSARIKSGMANIIQLVVKGVNLLYKITWAANRCYRRGEFHSLSDLLW